MLQTKFRLSLFHDPIVPEQTCVFVRVLHTWFSCWLPLLSAAAPAVVYVVSTCDIAIVSGTVTSHVRHLPYDHGRSVTPSGRFPLICISIYCLFLLAHSRSKTNNNDNTLMNKIIDLLTSNVLKKSDNPPQELFVMTTNEQWRIGLGAAHALPSPLATASNECPFEAPTLSPLATQKTSSVTSSSPRSSVNRWRSSFSISTLISWSIFASSMRLRPRSELLCCNDNRNNNNTLAECLLMAAAKAIGQWRRPGSFHQTKLTRPRRGRSRGRFLEVKARLDAL